jgi:hypothetical protein
MPIFISARLMDMGYLHLLEYRQILSTHEGQDIAEYAVILAVILAIGWYDSHDRKQREQRIFSRSQFDSITRLERAAPPVAIPTSQSSST